MFEFDSGNQGSGGPYLQWHVQGNKQISAHSFSVKVAGEDQPRVDVTEKFKKGVIFDIDNIKTGWSNFPEWQWNDSIKRMAPKPGKEWEKGFSIPIALGKGETAEWLQASSGAWETFTALAKSVDPKDRPDGKLPKVKFIDTKEIDYPKGGSTAYAILEIVEWVNRPESLDAANEPVSGMSVPSKPFEAVEEEDEF